MIFTLAVEKVVIMELRMEGSVMSSARLNSSMSLTSRMGEMRVTSRRPSDRSGFPGGKLRNRPTEVVLLTMP